jgi:hypothetical protein
MSKLNELLAWLEGKKSIPLHDERETGGDDNDYTIFGPYERDKEYKLYKLRGLNSVWSQRPCLDFEQR